VLLEWTGFEVDGTRDGHLGRGFDVALESARLTAVRGDELTELKRQTAAAPGIAPRRAHAPLLRRELLLWGEHLRPAPAVSLEPAFSILVVVDDDEDRDRGRDRDALAWRVAARSARGGPG